MMSFDTNEWHGTLCLAKMILVNLCLGIVAISSYFNGIITLSLTVTITATIIKLYKLDPEPFFLLALHTIISCLMFHDVSTTLAIMTAVAVTCHAAGSIQVSSDKIAVCVVSFASSCLLGTIASAFAALVLLIAIIAAKLRPLKPATYCTLGFMLLCVSVPTSGHVTAIMSGLMVLIVTAGYLIERARAKLLSLENEEGLYNVNNNNDENTENNNSNLSLMNGGYLQLINPTDSLDLHGHTVTSALKTLLHFLKEHEDSYRKNRTGHTRFVKVITGEDGKNHPEDILNLIKPTVANFLKINKYRFQVHPDRPGILRIDLESHVT